MSATPTHGTPPEDDDFVAAEYVLGVLPPAEKHGIERRIETDVSFARLVARWQQQFDGMNTEFEPAVPPADMKGLIDKRLFGTVSPQAAPLLSSLAFWRTFAFAALLLAAIGFGRDLLTSPIAPERQLVASMEADGSAYHTIAVYNETDNQLKVSLVKGELPTDRSLELWLIAGSDAPVSLGLMKSSQTSAFSLDSLLAGKLQDGATLAISLEPLGGSPSKAPTGAVIAAGTVRGI
ncbi:anti-sigma factor [Phyllobacterium sp. SB3]|uniref:anti-sigma factor n=1 Tax=Phyllobacterium sp. SB3 TaxID=3156073 RepID=UPI0032AFE5E4